VTKDDQGSTFVTTYTPGGGTVASIFLVTTTGLTDAGTLTSYATSVRVPLTRKLLDSRLQQPERNRRSLGSRQEPLAC